MNDPTQKDRFLELLETNQDILHKICHLYGGNEEDRRDLSQEIVYQLWKSYRSFRGKAKFTTWMYRLSLNTAMLHLRRNRHKHGITSLEEHHQQIPAPVQDLERANDITRLYAAIQRLRRFDRALIMLHLDRLSYRDIAEVTGISEGNVSVRLVRIKKRLKEFMQKET